MEHLRVSFGRRLGAYLIDVIVLVVLAVIGSMIGKLILGNTHQSSEVLKRVILGFIFGFYMLAEALTGFTPGKLLLGIRAATQEGNIGSIGFYIRRFFVKNIATVVNVLNSVWFFPGGVPEDMLIIHLIVFVLGVFFVVSCLVAIGERRQALHDRIAKSAVYYKDDLGKEGLNTNNWDKE